MKPVWTIIKILNWTKQYFADKGVENPRLDAEILLCAVLKCERINLYMDFERPLNEQELADYKKLVIRRAQNEPLAYILGEKAFMKNVFKVNKYTLVPRPETELLVESLIKASELVNSKPRILDIGTGSGAIIVSLLDYLPQAVGAAVDISAGALSVAKENAVNIGVDKRAAFIQSDLFAAIPENKKFDIIVSNPPYIPAQDIKGLAKDVQNEPLSALDGGEDGLDFYRRITRNAVHYLADDGLLAFEIGIGQSKDVADLCRSAGLGCVAVRKDYAGIDRMVFAAKEGGRYADILLEIAK